MDSIDRFEQVKVDKRRYQRSRDDQVLETELHALHLRWYYKYELTMMLEQAGFQDIFVHGDYTDAPATAQSSETVYSVNAASLLVQSALIFPRSTLLDRHKAHHKRNRVGRLRAGRIKGGFAVPPGERLREMRHTAQVARVRRGREDAKTDN